MINFIIMFCIVVIFTRIFLNKYDIKSKDTFAVIIALILSIFLNLIQFIIDLILKMIL
jgi:hypothetical protein